MKILLLRHGKTAGNLEHRYVGRTDEGLCQLGKEELEKIGPLTPVDHVFVSPMLRCLETAQILFPGQDAEQIADLRECDFGDFEYKNYEQLKEDRSYQKWLDSNGHLPFPGGESREGFQKRCVDGFQQILNLSLKKTYQEIALVAHGGTIMSILDKWAGDYGSYYDFQVKNGCGFLTELMIDFHLRICYSIEKGTYVPYKRKML